jgi:hypothetical protein
MPSWPVEQKYIDEAQVALGVRFPRNFVARLRRLNGGWVSRNGETWEFHPVWDRSDRRRLSRTSNDIVRETQFARSWPGFPSDGVAIARGAGAERLVLLPSEGDPEQLGEQVYEWDPHCELVCIAETVMDLWVNTDDQGEDDAL